MRPAAAVSSMEPLLIFALALFGAVLASCLTARTAASVPAAFITVGVIVGGGGLGWMSWQPQDPPVEHLARYALLAVLFTDGMRIGWRELRQAWALPGRALLLGLPATLLLLALAARFLTGLDWLHALLLAAVLTPTDPVFAAAIVSRDEVPASLRRLLNVESGVNDGLALPVVLVLIGLLTHEGQGSPLPLLLLQVAGGVALGLALPWVAKRLRPRSLERHWRPLYGVAVGLLGYALADTLGVNEYLTAFCSGMSMASVDPALRDAFHPLGEQVGELLKLVTLLVFGALLSPRLLLSLQPGDYLFAAVALLVARPLGLLLSLLRSRLDWRLRLAAAWFGPKGFASLIYAIVVLNAGVSQAERLYHVAALVIAVSIVAHSSTDVPLARKLAGRRRAPDRAPAEPRSAMAGGEQRLPARGIPADKRQEAARADPRP